MPRPSPLKAGDWVEIRSAREIEATLDRHGDCDRMPFMPEMLRFAGQRFQVTASAHKTCDTIHRTGGRRLDGAVHLADLRCDGAAHGGCQAECLLFWKQAWLRKVDGPAASDSSPADNGTGDLEAMLMANAARSGADGVVRYRCQTTRLFDATEPLPWWDLRQYWQDVRSGNATAGHALSTLLLACVFNLRRLPFAYRFNCAVYRVVYRLVRGKEDPHLRGVIPLDQPTPDVRSDLRVGELVEVESKERIEQTTNTENRNRGLNIDEEMTDYCGGRFRVSTRVERIVDERSGAMLHFKNPCIVLADVVCRGSYSEGRLLCPRKITMYWREAWLKRVDDPGS